MRREGNGAAVVGEVSPADHQNPVQRQTDVDVHRSMVATPGPVPRFGKNTLNSAILRPGKDVLRRDSCLSAQLDLQHAQPTSTTPCRDDWDSEQDADGEIDLQEDAEGEEDPLYVENGTNCATEGATPWLQHSGRGGRVRAATQPSESLTTYPHKTAGQRADSP